MKNVFDLVKNNSLFAGIAYSDFDKMLDCLSARTHHYQNNEMILLSGTPVNFVGLMLSGNAKIIKEDQDGNPTIIAELSSSDIFGEVFACAEIAHSPVSVLSTGNCEVLFIDYTRITTVCSSACQFHTQLAKNMLRLIARKNLLLNQKIELLSKRTTREKLLLFFDMQRNYMNKFTIPYNREEMAQFLCVDRSAMSNELCKMRNEGLIKFYKNEFELL